VELATMEGLTTVKAHGKDVAAFVPQSWLA
jgi:hypothetical protein